MATTEDKDGWPVTEDIDSVIIRLIRSNHIANGKSNKKPTITKLDPHKISRKTNPDNIRHFIRSQHQGLPNYREIALRVFSASGNERLGLSSIVNMIFDFPNTPEKKDRHRRAARSLQVALRCYAGGKSLFDEPIKDIYEVKVKR
jgi:hypothetical protein